MRSRLWTTLLFSVLEKRPQHVYLRLQREQTGAVFFDRLDQAIQGGVEIVIPWVGERKSEFSGRVANEIKIPFVG